MNNNHAWTGAQYERSLHRNNLLHRPKSFPPSYGLAVIQHLLTGFAFDPREAMKAFPDGDLVYRRVVNLFELYDFKVSNEDVDQFLACVTCLILVLRACFGLDGAARVWALMFAQAQSDVACEFSKDEPVFTYRQLERADEHEGWDREFPGYGLLTQKVLRLAVKPGSAMMLAQMADLVPEDKYMAQMVSGIIQTQYKLPSEGGSFVPDSTLGGSIGEVAFEDNPQTISAVDKTIKIRGKDVNGYSYGTVSSEALGHDYAQTPTFPVKGKTYMDMKMLRPIHRFGYDKAPRQMPHSGLDVPGGEGTEIVAIYDGVVTKVFSEWTSKTTGHRAPKGNYVVLTHTFSVNGKSYKFTSEYYHLLSANEGLSVGDEVEAGDVIGKLGNTGNSHGAHLHFMIYFSDKVDQYGRSQNKRLIDPEPVLINGLIPTMMKKGVNFGEAVKGSLSNFGSLLRGTASGNMQFSQADRMDFGDILGRLTEFASKVEQKAQQAGSKAQQVGGKVLDAGFDAFAEGSSGREVLKTMYMVALPGSESYVGPVLDALERGHKANMSGEDVTGILAHTLGDIEMNDEDRAKAIKAGVELYQATKKKEG